MALIDNGKPEEFLLFVRNFKMTLEASGTLDASAKLHCIYTLLRGEALHKFDTLCDQVRSTNITNLSRILLGLGTYSSPVNMLSKQKCVMHRGMSNTCELKVRRHASHLIDLNDYLAAFQ